jgi:hypothetical protein
MHAAQHLATITMISGRIPPYREFELAMAENGLHADDDFPDLWDQYAAEVEPMGIEVPLSASEVFP